MYVDWMSLFKDLFEEIEVSRFEEIEVFSL